MITIYIYNILINYIVDEAGLGLGPLLLAARLSLVRIIIIGVIIPENNKLRNFSNVYVTTLHTIFSKKVLNRALLFYTDSGI